MATKIEKVWSEDSDEAILKSVVTQHTLDKEKKMSKFSTEAIKDFINDANRRKFGHICNKCKNMKYCDKWQGKIILSCDKY